MKLNRYTIILFALLAGLPFVFAQQNPKFSSLSSTAQVPGDSSKPSDDEMAKLEQLTTKQTDAIKQLAVEVKQLRADVDQIKKGLSQ